MCCAASIASVKLPKWQAPTARRPSSGDSLSSIRVEKASVPSEPTRICARLTRCGRAPARRDCSRRPGAAPREARLDLVGLARAEREQVARQRPERRAGRSERSAPPGRNAPPLPSASTASIDRTFSRVLP